MYANRGRSKFTSPYRACTSTQRVFHKFGFCLFRPNNAAPKFRAKVILAIVKVNMMQTAKKKKKKKSVIFFANLLNLAQMPLLTQLTFATYRDQGVRFGHINMSKIVCPDLTPQTQYNP